MSNKRYEKFSLFEEHNAFQLEKVDELDLLQSLNRFDSLEDFNWGPNVQYRPPQSGDETPSNLFTQGTAMSQTQPERREG